MYSRLRSRSARSYRTNRHIRCGARLLHPPMAPIPTTVDELTAALQCSPVDLSLVTSLVSRDPSLRALLCPLTGVSNCNHATLALQIVSIGIEPLIRILCTLKHRRESSAHFLERDYQ
jgi:hypothetical protein